MAIYYFDGNIIGRSSGRSSVGAAAYRAGEKLRSVAHAAYQSGNELRDGEGEIVHDYTRKGGVVHSEIILPEGAPEEYKDRETLWNAVEKRERRKDAQLAREFIVGLQREFNLQEQINVLREYVKESFVDKGMIADFSIHDKKDGNPHAHIMLTFRDVTPDGFGLKNTTWNASRLFLEWRKNWAEVNNRMFERKGLDERIDHRSYAEQGLDREPMIHLGYEAAALERQGIKTQRGNHNREIQRRNERRAIEGAVSEAQNQESEYAPHHAVNLEREAKKEPEQHETVKTEQHTEELLKIAQEVQLEKELQKIREVQKTTWHIEKPLEPAPESPFVSELEKQLKVEKATQYIEKSQSPRDAVKTAQYMNGLKETYVALEKEKIPLMEQHNKDKYEIPKLEYRAELMEEHAKNIETLQSRVAQLQKTRQNLSFLQRTKKQETDAQIAQATQELERAQDFFANRFHIDPTQSPAELNRLQQEIRTKQDDLNTKQILVQAIRKKQASSELAYHTQKLLNETRPDREQISQLLEQTRHPPASLRDRLLHEQIDRRLNTITDYSFEKVINNLPPYQAHILTSIREQAKEHQRQIERERERNRTIDRSR
ncbi:MAG: MobA/MobL family protein [Nitrososphaerota archaeon]|nr:MobA/MobL family protein [Nitrososphaerota archaeon]